MDFQEGLDILSTRNILIMQLQILQETAEATTAEIAVNIENCGKLGIFLIRQLVSHLPEVQFNFIGFNKYMVEKLNALQPLENPIYYNYLLRPREEETIVESITLVGAEMRQPVGKTPTKKVTTEKTSAVIENLKEQEGEMQHGNSTVKTEELGGQQETRRKEPGKQKQEKSTIRGGNKAEKLTPEKLLKLKQQFPDIDWEGDLGNQGIQGLEQDSVDVTSPALRPGF
jgi:hypothetical protein